MNEFFSSRMRKYLKIGLVTHNFPNSEKERVNAGIFSYDLAKALSRKAEVVVFSPGKSEGIKKINGIKTYFFKFNDKLGSLKFYNPFHIIKFIQFFISGQKALNKFILENRNIDVVISMWAFPGGNFANYLSKKFNIPYAIYCLGSDIYVYAQKPILRTLIRNYLRNAKFILADGIDLAKQAQELSGKKVQFLPSTSNFPITNSRERRIDKTTFTFLGRLEKIKGVDLFVETLNTLSKENMDFQANIIGGGSLDDWIRQKIHSKAIKLWGNLNDSKKISAILRDSDWLVIPSRSDSIPLVFSEAVKLSLPVIAADLSDLKYLVKEYKVGYLFKNGDSTDLTNVLKKALRSKKDYANFQTNTKKVAKIFDLNESSDRLINLIKQSLYVKVKRNYE